MEHSFIPNFIKMTSGNCSFVDMGSVREIDKLRSLSQIFTSANFKRIIHKKDYSTAFYPIIKYSNCNQVNGEALQEIYNSLLKSYRNEYVYKNILVTKLLYKKYSFKNTIALNEFRIGNSIADFILLNGKCRVYEIKTELDGLDKLPKQIQDYRKFADEIYIVASSNHLAALKEDYINSNIGIIELTKRNSLKTIKEASIDHTSFQHEVIFKTLRKNEYLQIINKISGEVPNVPNTKIFRECLKIARSIPVEEFQAMVVQIIKERKLGKREFVEKKSIPDCLNYICYDLNLNNKQYDELSSFLSKKVSQCISHT